MARAGQRNSPGLTGNGLDPVTEFIAAGTVVWQLRGEIAGQERETNATGLIGVTHSPKTQG